jgi:hypothetical protein
MISSRVVSLALVTGASCLPLGQVLAQDEFAAYRQQQRQAVQQAQSEFRAYKEQQDKEFAGFLKAQWAEFETFQGKVRIKEPKPRQAPVVPALANKPPVPAPLVKPAPSVPVPPAPPVQQPAPLATNEMELLFFGNAVRVVFDTQWKSYRLSGEAKPEVFSDFWTQMSGSRYEATIQAVNAARQALKLDDWGYVTLWREVVRELQPGRKSEQNLLLWFFLIKSGYDVRLGYYAADVHLFVAIKQPVYSTKYTRVLNQTYYAALAADRGNGIRAFYSYNASYPNKLSALDIHAATTGFTKTLPVQRTLTFDYQGKTISFSVPYDRRLVDYVATFPQSEFELYFDTDGSPLLREALLSELRRYTATMGQEEAVNFLLAFVQKAFAYKTDNEQFGYEKYFFIEESLYYPYNDCEDRSILFAWLVRELVGIPVVGVLYPGHMTTAVELKQVKDGLFTVEYRDRRFVIADPTYIGASVGMAMPSYAKYKPKRMVEIR